MLLNLFFVCVSTFSNKPKLNNQHTKMITMVTLIACRIASPCYLYYRLYILNFIFATAFPWSHCSPLCGSNNIRKVLEGYSFDIIIICPSLILAVFVSYNLLFCQQQYLHFYKCIHELILI